MRSSSIAILTTTVVISFLLWVFINKPHHPVESSYPINSISFNPYQRYESPFNGTVITPDHLEKDIQLLKNKSKTLRLYSSTFGMEITPQVAKKYKLSVIGCAFIQYKLVDNPQNDIEVDAAIEMARNNRNVTKLIIGNETQLHKTVPQEELVTYLERARKKLRTPVSTAEPWDFWITNPEFADNVDFIAIHVLPYWAEIPINEAVDYVVGKYRAVKNMYPYKEVFIAETGWPSDGPQRGAAVPSVTNQAQFVRDFIERAEKEKIPYNIIEAFDQPWKQSTEGNVGEHWGIMDADRHDKFPIKGPVLEDPNWKYWAFASTILGLLASSLFVLRRHDLHLKGRIFSVFMFQLAAALATQLAREASDQYMSPGDIIFWMIVITAQTLLAIILLTDAVEIADVVGNAPLKRRYLPANADLPPDAPFVSIHLACCKEPPSMVIATIDSLAKLEYPNYEVIVVDNNTPDENLWKPVEARCKELGKRFRFFHLEKWPGFKAGALNFALKQTDPRAQVVGVVDADYVVASNWLKATLPYFIADKDIALVQAPQEHREWSDNLFTRMENDEYTGFFRIGMVQRNEHNAIIQHGTMTLIDRATLVKLNGWAEWCICEDAELGLRILNEKKKSVYLDHAFGHGLVPDSYEAYAKQRFRWAYGAMRILRHHWKTMFGLEGNLNPAQRYQFVKGWLPWIGDSLHLLFTFTGLLWSGMLIFDPLKTEFPEPIFIYPALALVVLRILGTLWTYTARVKIGKRRTLMAMIAGGALTHRIARAVMQGLITNSQPFYRTPKMDKDAPILKNLLSVREEIFFTTLLYASAFGVYRVFGTVNFSAIIWIVALIIQSFPYLAAITAALVSGASSLKRKMEIKQKAA
ncbi:glycosyltransferase [bacterium]|nr:glycosyltransferase [bacterium]